MRRYGSLGLSKPHLEPIIGVILSQFNQSKRDWGVEGGAGRGCERWSNMLECRESSWAPALWTSAAALTCTFTPGHRPVPTLSLIMGSVWSRWVVLAQVREREPQKVFKATFHWQDNVRDADPTRHEWHLSPWGDPGKQPFSSFSPDRLDHERAKSSQRGMLRETERRR